MSSAEAPSPSTARRSALPTAVTTTKCVGALLLGFALSQLFFSGLRSEDSATFAGSASSSTAAPFSLSASFVSFLSSSSSSTTSNTTQSDAWWLFSSFSTSSSSSTSSFAVDGMYPFGIDAQEPLLPPVQQSPLWEEQQQSSQNPRRGGSGLDGHRRRPWRYQYSSPSRAPQLEDCTDDTSYQRDADGYEVGTPWVVKRRMSLVTTVTGTSSRAARMSGGGGYTPLRRHPEDEVEDDRRRWRCPGICDTTHRQGGGGGKPEEDVEQKQKQHPVFQCDLTVVGRDVVTSTGQPSNSSAPTGEEDNDDGMEDDNGGITAVRLPTSMRAKVHRWRFRALQHVLKSIHTASPPGPQHATWKEPYCGQLLGIAFIELAYQMPSSMNAAAAAAGTATGGDGSGGGTSRSPAAATGDGGFLQRRIKRQLDIALKNLALVYGGRDTDAAFLFYHAPSVLPTLTSLIIPGWSGHVWRPIDAPISHADLIASYYFLNGLQQKYVLITQRDVLLMQPVPHVYLSFDYVGLPWGYEAVDWTGGGGEGGDADLGHVAAAGGGGGGGAGGGAAILKGTIAVNPKATETNALISWSSSAGQRHDAEQLYVKDRYPAGAHGSDLIFSFRRVRSMLEKMQEKGTTHRKFPFLRMYLKRIGQVWSSSSSSSGAEGGDSVWALFKAMWRGRNNLTALVSFFTGPPPTAATSAFGSASSSSSSTDPAAVAVEWDEPVPSSAFGATDGGGGGLAGGGQQEFALEELLVGSYAEERPDWFRSQYHKTDMPEAACVQNGFTLTDRQRNIRRKHVSAPRGGRSSSSSSCDASVDDGTVVPVGVHYRALLALGAVDPCRFVFLACQIRGVPDATACRRELLSLLLL